MSKTCCHFFVITLLALSQSGSFSLYVSFRLFCQTLFSLKCLHSIETEKLLIKIVVPKLQSLTLLVTKRVVLLAHCILLNVPNSPQNHKMISVTILLGRTAPQNLMSSSSVNFVIKSFQDFTLYVSIETLNTECKSTTRDVNVEHMVGDIEDHRLREELRSCQHFLVDSELERARHKVFNYAVETLNETIVNEELDQFFINLNCVPKMNLAFGFILKNIEDGEFRYFYAHENNTLLDRSKLVCTHDVLI